MTVASDVTPHFATRSAGAAAIAAGMRPVTAKQSPDSSAWTHGVVQSHAAGVPNASEREHADVEAAAAKAAAIAVIGRARTVLNGRKPVSATTAQDYQKKVAVLSRAALKLPGGSGNRLVAALATHAPKSSSYYAYRAAVTWFLGHRAAEILQQQDRLQKEIGQGVEWLAKVSLLQKAMDGVELVQGARRSEALERTGAATKQKHSKRDDLARIEKAEPGWKQKIVEASAPTRYGEATQVIARFGCRPEELVRGVRLELVGEHLVATIVGAKVTETAGQPWRRISIRAGSVSVALLDKVRTGGPISVQIDTTGGFRAHLQRLSKRLLPELPGVTAYVFRHSFVGELRESDWDAEEIALRWDSASLKRKRNMDLRLGVGRARQGR